MYTTMPSEVRNQHEPLNNEVIGLHSKWKMFKTLYAEDTSTIDLLNWAAPGAFYFLEQLQLDEIIIAIRRLTDSETTGRGHAQQHNLTLKRLVNTIDATAYPSLRVQADNLLAQVETTCAPIRNYSHKNVAHINWDPITERKVSPYPIPNATEIENAINAIGNLMNVILDFFEDAEFDYEFPLADTLVNRLSQARQYCDELLQKE